MKRQLLLILFGLASAVPTLAQGFDWQYSARNPTESPRRFLGAVVSAGYATHQGSLPYLERDLSIPCCTYENGSGLPLGFGLTFEQWLPNNIAAYGAVGYRLLTASFVAPSTQSEPMFDGRTLVTQYEYGSTLHYLDISGGTRYRLPSTHFSLGVGVRVQVLVGSAATHTHRVISPSDFYFTENPPSQVKEFRFVNVADAAPLVIAPYLTVGYDISLANGMYLSPLATVGIPVMSTASNATWNTTDIGILIRILRAF